MTQRESQASSGATVASLRPTAAHAASTASAPLARPSPGPLPLWENLCRGIPPAQQSELLSLARRQGILYSHQLPAPDQPAPTDHGRQLLGQLLRGQTAEIEPVRGSPVECVDPELDSVQCEAVARALRTPDVFLLQGLPGTGKSRVVAEIVTQAAARGERVLLLAPQAAAIDRVLEMVGSREEVCPMRCLDPEGGPESLPPSIRTFTFAERVRTLRQDAIQGARQEVAEAEERCRRFGQDEHVWPQLQELAQAAQRIKEQAARLPLQRAQVREEVTREAASAVAETPAQESAFATAVRGLDRSHREALQQLSSGLEAARIDMNNARHDLVAVAGEIGALRPMVEAKRQGRWWTGAWWQARMHKRDLASWSDLETRHKKLQMALEVLETKTRQLIAAQEQAASAQEHGRAELIEAEVIRRQSELDERQADLQREHEALESRSSSLCRELAPEVLRPPALTVQGIQAAIEAWRRQRERENERLAFARQWLAYLDEAGDPWSARLPGYVNLVAATMTTFPVDAHFGDTSANGTSNPCQFDLLILEDADQVAESEFQKVARRARRWILVGEPANETSTAAVAVPSPTRKPSRFHELHKPMPIKPLAAAAPRPGWFHRLWQQLHCDPRQLPYAWVQEGNRLCCRLRPIKPEEASRIESERVADFPDIELRILSVPRSQPALVEVVFPPSLSIYQAKEYIFRELGEVPVKATGRSLRWTEEPDRLVLWLADHAMPTAVPVTLDAGVREMVGTLDVEPNGPSPTQTAWQTCRVEFDRRLGWQRQRAEEWVEQHLRMRDLGRTARLDVPHRMRPELARVVSDLLADRGFRESRKQTSEPCPANDVPTVAFMPVPAQDAREAGQHADGVSPFAARVSVAPGAAPKSGAGLEIDLADKLHRDRLSAALRSQLPQKGLVNLAEAEAVLQLVVSFLQGRNDLPKVPGETIAVLALYPAQAELIRLLLRQHAAGVDHRGVEVNVPTAFRHREADVVLLSLTRSHAHRAVALGEDAHSLALALTRARRRLVLVGDPGTLFRRSQAHGSLDHLDEAAAAREGQLVSRLLPYLRGQGLGPEVLRLREGSPT